MKCPLYEAISNGNDMSHFVMLKYKNHVSEWSRSLTYCSSHKGHIVTKWLICDKKIISNKLKANEHEWWCEYVDPATEAQHHVLWYRGSVHPEEKEQEKQPKPWVCGPVNPGTTNWTNWTWWLGTGTGSSSLLVPGEGDGNTRERPIHQLITFYNFQGGSGRILYPDPQGCKIHVDALSLK